MRIWEKYLPQRDRDILSAAGYSQLMGFGERPALVVIDVNYNFTGDRPEPVEESIKRWPNSCGEMAWSALPHINRAAAAMPPARNSCLLRHGWIQARRLEHGQLALEDEPAVGGREPDQATKPGRLDDSHRPRTRAERRPHSETEA